MSNITDTGAPEAVGDPTPPADPPVKSDPVVPPNPPVDNELAFMRDRASAFVMIAFTMIVLAIVYVLHLQIERMEARASTPTFDRAVTLLDKQVIKPSDDNFEFQLRAAIESDAQFLRSMRAQSGLSARLMVQVVAELVGLSLIVLGGTLIFARIRASAGAETATFEGVGLKVAVLTTYPGLILCVVGAAVCAWTLQITVNDNARITTNDGAIYILGKARPATERKDHVRSKEICESIGYDKIGCEAFK
ncbi:MAG: hypothetical protein ACPGVA_12360 [Pikeienuella sp.]